MPVIFAGNTGRVFAADDKVAQGSISLGNVTGVGGDLAGFGIGPLNTIITRIGVSSSGNYQFLHTIGNDVYVYVFGDRMGEITLHGLSFAQDCNARPPLPPPGSPPGPPPRGGDVQGKHGFERLFDWYQRSRLAVNPNPVTVRLGFKTIFKGFMTGITGDVNDSMTRTIQFQLTISLLPDAPSSGLPAGTITLPATGGPLGGPAGPIV
jgi:hypothetical protein